MGERVGVSSLTQERGNRVEEKKEKWESLQPLGRAAQGQGGESSSQNSQLGGAQVPVLPKRSPMWPPRKPQKSVRQD